MTWPRRLRGETAWKRHFRILEYPVCVLPLAHALKRCVLEERRDRFVWTAALGCCERGTPWRDVPERFGKWTTIHSRLCRRTARGIWQDIFDESFRQADQSGQPDWSKHVVDGTVIRAHPCAARCTRGAAGRGTRTIPQWIRHQASLSSTLQPQRGL